MGARIQLLSVPCYIQETNAMLLLTNCEVHAAKDLDCSFEVQKTKVQTFSTCNKQPVNESLIV